MYSSLTPVADALTEAEQYSQRAGAITFPCVTMRQNYGTAGEARMDDGTLKMPRLPSRTPRRHHQPVLLITSPHAGSRNSADDAVQALADAGLTVGLHLTVDALDDGTPLGPAWQRMGYRVVVAAGGDGTISAVASHIANVPIALGILPAGTSNDTARSLGVPINLREAAQLIASGSVELVACGEAVPAVADAHPAAMSHPPRFLHALTLGFNTEFARLATLAAQRERWGPLTYITSAIEALQRFEAMPMTVAFRHAVRLWPPDPAHTLADELTLHVRPLQIAAVNLPIFGGALNLRMPDVDHHDDVLDFVILDALDIERLREELGRIVTRLTGQVQANGQVSSSSDAPNLFSALPGIHRYQAREASIHTERPLDVTLDGEIRARTPVVIRSGAHRVRVIVPRRSGAHAERSGKVS